MCLLKCKLWIAINPSDIEGNGTEIQAPIQDPSVQYGLHIELLHEKASLFTLGRYSSIYAHKAVVDTDVNGENLARQVYYFLSELHAFKKPLDKSDISNHSYTKVMGKTPRWLFSTPVLASDTFTEIF